MGKEILTFSNIEIKKNKFDRRKSPVPLNNVDVENVLVSNKIFWVKKTINILLVACIMIITLDHYV